VLSGLQRSLSDNRVKVVGRGHHYTINVLLLFEHLAEIGVACSLVELLLELDALGPIFPILLQLVVDLAPRVPEIDVGVSDEILGLRQRLRVLDTHAAEPNYREVHGVARRLESHAAQDVARDDHHTESDLAAIGDEFAPGDFLTCHTD
jgi:hypothetical protein